MYSRIQNENGSFNSRCLDCMMTIACCVETDQELERLERRHICPEKALHELMEQEISAAEKARENHSAG